VITGAARERYLAVPAAIYLPDWLVEAARFRPDDPALGPLSQVLQKHSAGMKCQFDAFADYVAEAGREGASQYPLYEWTKETSQIRRRCKST
jgi:hypothetical protein